MTNWFDSIDVDQYVQGLIKKESDQIDKSTSRQLQTLTDSQSALNVRISSYGSLTSQLTDGSASTSIKSLLENLMSSFNPIYQATSNNTSALTVSLTGNSAPPGTHTVVTRQLAQAATFASTANITTTDDPLGIAENITISDGTRQFIVPVNTGNTLQDICDKINKNADILSANVSATIVTNSAGKCQLIVSSTKTGEDNQVSIQESGAHPLGLDTTIPEGSGGAKIIKAAQNAKFTFDGMDIESDSNTYDIYGMSITVLTGTNDDPVTTTISVQPGSNPTKQVTDAAQKFVDAYNTILSTIAKTQATSQTYDSNLKLLQSTLISALSAAFNGSGSYNTLADLGIILQPGTKSETTTVTVRDPDGSTSTRDVQYFTPGLLQVNADATKGVVFSKALASDFASAQELLTNANGIMAKLDTMLAETPVKNTSIGVISGLLRNAQTDAKASLKSVTDTLNTQKTQIDKQKKDLPRKYASLDVMLLKLQFTSRYLTAQMDAFKSS